MTRNRLALALVGLLAIALATPAAAQTCTGNPCNVNNTASVTVLTILKLTLNTSSTALTSPNEAAFDAGSQDDGGPVATVKSNRPWNLQISAQAVTWTGSGALARSNKPAGDLWWSRTGGAPWTALSTTPGNVYGTAQSAGGNQQTTFTYHTLWGWTVDTPGDYSLVVVYTATAP